MPTLTTGAVTWLLAGQLAAGRTQSRIEKIQFNTRSEIWGLIRTNTNFIALVQRACDLECFSAQA
jgi:hypothetical protein